MPVRLAKSPTIVTFRNLKLGGIFLRMSRLATTIIAVFALHAGLCFAQSEDSGARAQGEDTGTRKVVERVAPAYPTVARNMHISGTVKVEAIVASNGTVKSIEIKGGHPMLAQAAADAVTKWKWAPATHETAEPVQVTFGSQ
jgi:TonB family protein